MRTCSLPREPVPSTPTLTLSFADGFAEVTRAKCASANPKFQPPTSREAPTFKLQDQAPSLPRTWVLESPPKQPHQERQNRADDQTSHNREMKTEIPFAIMDVAWEASKPIAANSRPKDQS